jgi:hypothetical protein
VVGKTTWGLNAAFRDEHHMTPFTESKVLLTINLSGYSGHETIIPLKSGICTCLMKPHPVGPFFTCSGWLLATEYHWAGPVLFAMMLGRILRIENSME